MDQTALWVSNKYSLQEALCVCQQVWNNFAFLRWYRCFLSCVTVNMKKDWEIKVAWNISIAQHEMHIYWGRRVFTFLLATLDLTKPLVTDESFMGSDQVHSRKTMCSSRQVWDCCLFLKMVETCVKITKQSWQNLYRNKIFNKVLSGAVWITSVDFSTLC